MIRRQQQIKLLSLAKQFPVISIIGPRQSGKSTLVKHCFPQYDYISFEDIDNRRRALLDMRGFLEQYSKGVIFDEVQRVPELFSYLQTHVDETGKKGRFILTGSHNYLLQEKVSQSLAGRVAMLRLLPFSMKELEDAGKLTGDINKILFKGFYPRLFSSRVKPTDWYPAYIETYMQRDVREIKNIPNLNYFQKFLHLLAGRHGQQLNLTSLASEVGVVHNTHCIVDKCTGSQLHNLFIKATF
jgi:predicted AAA+ superfamily ATPase